MGISTSSFTFVPKSICNQDTLTKTITSLDRISKGNDTLSTPCLPCQDIKIVETTSPDVGDISSSLQTQIHKKHSSVALMTWILDTCDPKSYTDA